MKDEFIVVNKTKLLQRIGELIKEGDTQREIGLPQIIQIAIQQEKSTIRSIIAISTPLEPIVSDAWVDGVKKYCDSSLNIKSFLESDTKTKYINNLKLDI
jgi:hypothetical protein